MSKRFAFAPPYICLALLLQGSTLAQSASIPSGHRSTDRVRIDGKVLRLDGTPWQSAKVRFSSTFVWWLEGFGKADAVQTTTDAKGHFRVSLLRGRRYGAMAEGTSSSGQPAYTTGKVVTPTRYSRIQLSERSPLKQMPKVQVKGWQEWRGRHLRFFFSASNAVSKHGSRLPDPDEDGILRLPMTTLRYPFVTATTEQQRVVGRLHLNLHKPTPRKPLVLEVTEPHPVLIRISDDDGPVSGAMLRGLGSDDGFEGLTDSNGYVIYAHVRPPSRKKGVRIEPAQFLITAAGHAPLLYDCKFILNGAKSVRQRIAVPSNRSPSQLRRSDKPDLCLELKKSSRVSATFHWSNGSPASGLRLLIVSPLMRQGKPLLFPGPPCPPRFATCDKNGRMNCSTVAPGQPFQLWGDLGNSPLPPEARELCPVALLATGKAEAASTNLGKIKLDQRLLTHIRVRLADGSPATGVKLCIDAEPWGQLADLRYLPLIPQRNCELRMLISPSARIRIAAMHSSGFGFHVSTGMQKIDLTLNKGITIQGRFRTLSGDPIEGAQVVGALASNANGNVSDRIAMLRNLGSWSAPTDAAGRYSLRVPQAPAYVLKARKLTGGRIVHRSPWHRVEPESSGATEVDMISDK